MTDLTLILHVILKPTVNKMVFIENIILLYIIKPMETIKIGSKINRTLLSIQNLTS